MAGWVEYLIISFFFLPQPALQAKPSPLFYFFVSVDRQVFGVVEVFTPGLRLVNCGALHLASE